MSLVRHYYMVLVNAKLCAQQVEILADILLIVAAISVDVHFGVVAPTVSAVACCAECRRVGRYVIICNPVALS